MGVKARLEVVRLHSLSAEQEKKLASLKVGPQKLAQNSTHTHTHTEKPTILYPVKAIANQEI